MDTFGRYFGDKINIRINSIIILSILRTLLLISSTLFAKNIIENDILNILNLALFAFSNGFLSTLCCIKAPGLVKEDQRE
jgi:hypothetical protein